MKKYFSLIAVMMLMSAAMANAKSHTSSAEAPATTTMEQTNLHKGYKTSYVKDSEGRVVNKVIYKAVNNEWQPIGAYSAFYGEEESILSYAQWDSESHSFTRNAQQMHYTNDEFPDLLADPVK